MNNICDHAIGFSKLLFQKFFSLTFTRIFLKKILNHNKILYLLEIDGLTLIVDDQAMIY